jgi:hypothetical protein
MEVLLGVKLLLVNISVCHIIGPYVIANITCQMAFYVRLERKASFME